MLGLVLSHRVIRPIGPCNSVGLSGNLYNWPAAQYLHKVFLLAVTPADPSLINTNTKSMPLFSVGQHIQFDL